MRAHKTNAEKIHEFSHSCLFVHTVGVFVHSWLLKCKRRRRAAKVIVVLLSVSAKIVAGFCHFHALWLSLPSALADGSRELKEVASATETHRRE